MRECTCEEWDENIDKVLMAGYLYAHGIEYSGVLFRYCPWCGAVLTTVPMEDVLSRGQEFIVISDEKE